MTDKEKYEVFNSTFWWLLIPLALISLAALIGIISTPFIWIWGGGRLSWSVFSYSMILLLVSAMCYWGFRNKIYKMLDRDEYKDKKLKD